MKRYIMFSCDKYYPVGGWGDYYAQFDDIAEAQTWLESALSNPLADYEGSVQVVDTSEGAIIISKNWRTIRDGHTYKKIWKD